MKTEWRNISVDRDNEVADPIVTKLYKNSDTAVFQTIKELMVFAAMLGYCFDKKKHLTSDSRKRTSIILGTYASTEHDGFIYLLALLQNKDATCLKNFNIHESIKIFEEYCNGGLDLIGDWFRSNPADINKLDTLWQKIGLHLEMQNEDHNEDQDIQSDDNSTNINKNIKIIKA